MNSAHAHHRELVAPPIARHLTLVPPSDTPVRPRSRSASAAALLAGLTTGFVLSAAAAALGGGRSTDALRLATLCGAAALVARVHAVRKRNRRIRRPRTAASSGLREHSRTTVRRAA